MESFLIIFNFAVDLVFWIIIIQVILSWLINFDVLNLRQPLVWNIWNGLNRLLEPIYRPIRNMLPDLGGLDISPWITVHSARGPRRSVGLQEAQEPVAIDVGGCEHEQPYDDRDQDEELGEKRKQFVEPRLVRPTAGVRARALTATILVGVASCRLPFVGFVTHAPCLFCSIFSFIWPASWFSIWNCS
jgi:YggT family protein